MTYLIKDIRDHLMGSALLADAVGTHIYPEVIPQGVTWEAAIVLQEINSLPEYTLAGEVGTHITTMQVDIWTDGTGGRPRVTEIAELVRNRLSGYRGQFGDGEFGTARLVRSDSLAASPTDGSVTHKRRISQDYEIIHTADVPTFA